MKNFFKTASLIRMGKMSLLPFAPSLGRPEGKAIVRPGDFEGGKCGAFLTPDDDVEGGTSAAPAARAPDRAC